MKTTIISCLIFVLSLTIVTPFESYNPRTKPSTSSYSLNGELRKIQRWTCQEHISLWNNLFNCFNAMVQTSTLLSAAVVTIGLQEMRKSLGFPPPPPWSSYNATEHSEEEIRLAPSIQAYYELREPRQYHLHNAGEDFAKELETRAVNYMDGRVPQIRTIFTREFEKVRQLDTGLVDREVVDRMVDRFDKICKIVEDVIDKRTNTGESLSYNSSCESSQFAGQFSFIHSDALLSNPQKLLENTKRKSLPFSVSDIDSLLANISGFSDQDYKMLWKNTFTTEHSRYRISNMIRPALEITATEELVKTLGVSEQPRRGIAEYSFHEEELAAAETVEDYLFLKSYNFGVSEGSEFGHRIFKSLLDKRFPEVRMVFKMTFGEILQKNGGLVDRKVVDKMIEEMNIMHTKIKSLVTNIKREPGNNLN